MTTVINTKQAKNAKVEGKVCVKDDDFLLLDKVAATNVIEKKPKREKKEKKEKKHVTIVIPEESASDKAVKSEKGLLAEKPRKKVHKTKKHRENKKTHDNDAIEKTSVCVADRIVDVDPAVKARWDAWEEDQEVRRKLFNNLNVINKLLILPTLTILATIAIDNQVVSLLRNFAYGY